jgi:hypothetical protein
VCYVTPPPISYSLIWSTYQPLAKGTYSPRAEPLTAGLAAIYVRGTKQDQGAVHEMFTVGTWFPDNDSQLYCCAWEHSGAYYPAQNYYTHTSRPGRIHAPRQSWLKYFLFFQLLLRPQPLAAVLGSTATNTLRFQMLLYKPNTECSSPVLSTACLLFRNSVVQFLGHRPTTLAEVFAVPHTPSTQIPGQYLKQAVTASNSIISNSSFNNHPIVRRDTIGPTYRVVKQAIW